MKQLLVLLAVVCLLAGCSNTPEPANPPISTSSPSSIFGVDETKCKDLRIAEDSLAKGVQDMYDEWKEMEDQYDEEYWENFDRDATAQAFVDAYWKGFWSQHKYCKICQANGDVPEGYAKETSN